MIKQTGRHCDKISLYLNTDWNTGCYTQLWRVTVSFGPTVLLLLACLMPLSAAQHRMATTPQTLSAPSAKNSSKLWKNMQQFVSNTSQLRVWPVKGVSWWMHRLTGPVWSVSLLCVAALAWTNGCLCTHVYSKPPQKKMLVWRTSGSVWCFFSSFKCSMCSQACPHFCVWKWCSRLINTHDKCSCVSTHRVPPSCEVTHKRSRQDSLITGCHVRLFKQTIWCKWSWNYSR